MVEVSYDETQDILTMVLYREIGAGPLVLITEDPSLRKVWRRPHYQHNHRTSIPLDLARSHHNSHIIVYTTPTPSRT